MEKALAELGDAGALPKVEPRRVGQYASRRTASIKEIEPKYRLGDAVATRQAFGKAIEQLGALSPDVVVLDGDVKNSTGTELFAKKFPERFFEAYIAEHNMVGSAFGLAVTGKITYSQIFS